MISIRYEVSELSGYNRCRGRNLKYRLTIRRDTAAL
jgi:hypothetical protein